MKILPFLLLLFIDHASFAQVQNLAEKLGYPKNAKLAIIHSDDLGVSHSEDTASIAAMEHGSVSSASIMVPCPWLQEIASYAVTHPEADLGLHITLTSEWKNYKWGPVSDKQKVPGLVNERGYFYSAVDSVGMYASAAEVEEEIRAQVLKAKKFGINPTHLDAHMGTALSRTDFLKAYLKIGHEFNIPVFIPAELRVPLNVSWDTLLTAKDALVDHMLSISPEAFRADPNKFYTEGFKNLQPGLTYVIIHTAFDDSEMQAIAIDHPDWGAAWRQADYDYFTSQECRDALKANNIYVITWREIRDKIVRVR